MWRPLYPLIAPLRTQPVAGRVLKPRFQSGPLSPRCEPLGGALSIGCRRLCANADEQAIGETKERREEKPPFGVMPSPVPNPRGEARAQAAP